MNNNNLTQLMNDYKNSHDIDPLETMKVYNSCMDYYISKGVYFGNEKEIVLMAERFSEPIKTIIDKYKREGVEDE